MSHLAVAEAVWGILSRPHHRDRWSEWQRPGAVGRRGTVEEIDGAQSAIAWVVDDFRYETARAEWELTSSTASSRSAVLQPRRPPAAELLASRTDRGVHEVEGADRYRQRLRVHRRRGRRGLPGLLDRRHRRKLAHGPQPPHLGDGPQRRRPAIRHRVQPTHDRRRRRLQARQPPTPRRRRHRSPTPTPRPPSRRPRALPPPVPRRRLRRSRRLPPRLPTRRTGHCRDPRRPDHWRRPVRRRARRHNLRQRSIALHRHGPRLRHSIEGLGHGTMHPTSDQVGSNQSRRLSPGQAAPPTTADAGSRATASNPSPTETASGCATQPSPPSAGASAESQRQ